MKGIRISLAVVNVISVLGTIIATVFVNPVAVVISIVAYGSTLGGLMAEAKQK